MSDRESAGREEEHVLQVEGRLFWRVDDEFQATCVLPNGLNPPYTSSGRRLTKKRCEFWSVTPLTVNGTLGLT